MRRPRHELAVVATFNHRHQAELARGYLEDAGIPAAVTADDGGGAFGIPLPYSPGSFARLTVRRRDAERALERLESVGMLGDEHGEGDGNA